MSFQPLNGNVINYYTTLNKTFIVDTGIVSIGTAETPLFLLRNPSSSGVKANIFGYSFGTESGKPSIIRVYAKPTVTSPGTALTSVCMRQISSTGAIGAVLTFKSPSISVNGNLMKTFIINNSGNIGAGNPVEFNCDFLFEAGADLLITCQNQVNGTSSHAWCTWVEVAEEL